MITRVLEYLRRFHHGLRQTEHVYMVLIAIVIGVLGGLGAVGFRELIRLVNTIAWRQGQPALDHIQGLPIWWKVLVPSVGGLLVGLITYRVAREVKGHGVPEVIEAVALRGGRMRPRVVLAKLFASGISIGTGGSVGREGPIVQIGSAMASTIGQWLKIDPRRLRTLVGCGAAAGIAATFNAPIAGALFAVEVILGDFGVAQFSPIVISSVAGTVVSQHFLGDVPAFQVPSYSLVNVNELFAYAGLGILAGFIAVAFSRTLYAAEDLFDRPRIYSPLKPLIGGALIGVIGIWLPQIFGVGYETITEALTGGLGWQLMLVLVAAKLFAVSVTIGSGGSGGVFAPSLFIGAMLGGTIGKMVHSVWPEATATPGAYALVGMGAVVAAATQAPITAIVIIFELTGDYKIILPLMISCIIATLLANRLQSASIYTLKLLRRGVDIQSGRAVNVLAPVSVREVMRSDMMTVAPGDDVTLLISRFVEHPVNVLFVVDDENRLQGIITAEGIRPTMANTSGLSTLVIAQDLMVETAFLTVRPDDSLAEVMKLLGTYHAEVPVLSEGRLVGVIWPHDVIERYNTELFKRDMARGLVSAVSQGSKIGVPTAEDAVVVEIPVPGRFVGKTIRDLNIRHYFGFSILLIKRKNPDGALDLTVTPPSDFAFQADDVMLVMGPRKDLRFLKQGIPRK